MFAGFSCIFHLAVISLERLHETLRPFRQWQLSLKAYWVAIATPWTLSLFLSTFNLHTGKVSPEPTSSGSHCCYNLPSNPLLTTFFFYLTIWKKIKLSHENERRFPQNQEARFSKSIFLVTEASFKTWIPFLYCNVALYKATFKRVEAYTGNSFLSYQALSL